ASAEPSPASAIGVYSVEDSLSFGFGADGAASDCTTIVDSGSCSGGAVAAGGGPITPAGGSTGVSLAGADAGAAPDARGGGVTVILSAVTVVCGIASILPLTSGIGLPRALLRAGALASSLTMSTT